jgi:DNA-binding transcriptional ArsR family regulator
MARFFVRHADAVSRRLAQTLIAELERRTTRDPPMLAFRTASPEARALLREHGISYAGEDGEWFLLAPPVYVERPPVRRAPRLPPQARSPFAIKASRIARWMLLNLDAHPTLTELADAVSLSEPTVSRITAALANAGMIELKRDTQDDRVRRVGMRNTSDMLSGLERSSWIARVRGQTWDIGAANATVAITRWQQAAHDLTVLPYAIGGPAGASLLDRTLEPADVIVWIRDEDLSHWSEQLLAEPARPSRGTITVQRIPDPFWFTLAQDFDGLQIADPVQLYLDCRTAGERALELANSLREAMCW